MARFPAPTRQAPSSRRDRKLATQLYDRGVPLRVVRAAFVIAAAPPSDRYADGGGAEPK
jgi:hypothetical protein